MARPYHRFVKLFGGLALVLCLGLPAQPAAADVDRPPPQQHELNTPERRVPAWVWLVPPAGLLLGLGLGARLRGRNRRQKGN